MTDGGLSRRGFLLGSLATVLAACRNGGGSGSAAPTTAGAPTTEPPAPTTAPSTPAPTTSAAPALGLPSDPFTLGVASGDPTAGAVVLWTRLDPATIAGAGASEQDVEVTWEVGEDAQLDRIVTAGTATASPAYGHSVHIDVTGLEPATTYWYRFSLAGYHSTVGRTGTMPAPGDDSTRLVIGHASCQHYETGFYAAHRDIAASDLHALVWLGDYIYEGPGRTPGQDEVVRSHDSPEPADLAGYRARYERYKSDPDLQAAHAATPWFVIWDDHEVENNYAGDHSEDTSVPEATFHERRAAAYQAWWEHQPVRLPPPEGAAEKIYRSFTLGSLASLFLLDGRQYRSDQACGDVILDLSPACPDTFAPGRTMLGDEQERWLLEGLAESTTTWNVLGNQTILADITFNGAVLNYDQWDGYPEARQRLLYGIDQAGLTNVVALTGDIHVAGVTDLAVGDENGRHLIGSELVATSISSVTDLPAAATNLLDQFPDVRYAETAHRGWVRSVITPASWEAEYRIVEDATRPDSAVTTAARFTIDPATPGAVRVGG